MKMVSWRNRRATPRKPDTETNLPEKGEDVAAAAAASAAAAKEESVHTNNGMALMVTQALELARAEAVGKPATLGDMEVALRTIRPKSRPPSLESFAHQDVGSSNIALQTPSKAGEDVDPFAIKVSNEQGEVKEERELENENEVPLMRSPTSQFEYDILNANHPNLDFETLQKSYSRALVDEEDDDQSIISEESLHDEGSFVSEAPTVIKDDEALDFVSDVLSPFEWASDVAYCKMKCNFPNIVDEMNDFMSSDLHHMVFDGDSVVGPANEEEAVVVGEAQGNQDEDGGDNHWGEGPNDGREMRQNDEEGLGDAEVEDDDDEGGEEIVADGEQHSGGGKVEVVLGRWANLQSEAENAAYIPSKGFVLRKGDKLPELAEDQVMIRVDTTTLSTRDCLEVLRRQFNEDLKDDVWVPGHEIIGNVVRAGPGMEAKALLNKRIASILPNGGGCSRYVCIHAKDAIAVPDEAGSDEVVALLSTYMTAYQCLESVVTKKVEDDTESVVMKAKGVEDDAESVFTKATDVGSVGTRATDVESVTTKVTDVGSLGTKATDAESQAGGDEVGAKESPENMDDVEEKKSHLSGKNVLIIDAGSPIGNVLSDQASDAGATVLTSSHLKSSFFALRWRGEVDLVVDTVGDSANNPTLYKVMKTRGRLVRVNTTSCGEKYVPRSLLGKTPAGKDKSYYGRVVNDKAVEYDLFQSFNDDKEAFAEDLAFLCGLVQSGKIQPKIYSRLDFGQLECEWEKVMVELMEGSDVVLVSPWKLGFTMMNG